MRIMPKKQKPIRGSVTLNIPREMLETIRALAEVNGQTISGWVRVAVREKLQRESKPKEGNRDAA